MRVPLALSHVLCLLLSYACLWELADTRDASWQDPQGDQQTVWHFETTGSSNLSAMQIRAEQVFRLF